MCSEAVCAEQEASFGNTLIGYYLIEVVNFSATDMAQSDVCIPRGPNFTVVPLYWSITAVPSV